MQCIGLSPKRIARPPGGAEHSAQSELLAPSAVSLAIRAANFLRSGSERNFLLDDEAGDGPVAPSRILDHRIECCGERIAGCRHPAASTVANILSAGRHRTYSGAARRQLCRNSPRSANGIGAGESKSRASSPTSRRSSHSSHIWICLSDVPGAQFELAMNLNRDDPEIARLRKRGWRVVSPHRVARTPACLSAIYCQRQRGIYRDQRRRCGLADRMAERPRRGLSGDGSAGHYRRHRGRKLSAARERIPFRRAISRVRKPPLRRSRRGLAAPFGAGARLRGGGLRCREKPRGKSSACDATKD